MLYKLIKHIIYTLIGYTVPQGTTKQIKPVTKLLC